MIPKLARRDKCGLTGSRALRLTDAQAVAAWRSLADELLGLGDTDVPKFKHLLRAIRKATITGRRRHPSHPSH